MVWEVQVGRLILWAALALSMSGCVRPSPTEPTDGAAAGGKKSSSAPNLAGNWSGTYVNADCRQSQQIGQANLCGQLGDSGSYRLSIAQGNQVLNVSVSLGDVQFPSTPVKLGANGTLGWSTSVTSNPYNVTAELAITVSDTNIVGSVKQFWTSSTLSGKATLTGRITTAARTP
jgi:hypothetical protein